MTAQNATYAYGELADGTEWANVRVTVATKVQLERSMRANRWDVETNPFTTAAFMSWHAARAAQAIPSDLDFERFLAEAVDAGVTNDVPTSDEADPDRPTQTAATTI